MIELRKIICSCQQKQYEKAIATFLFIKSTSLIIKGFIKLKKGKKMILEATKQKQDYPI